MLADAAVLRARPLASPRLGLTRLARGGASHSGSAAVPLGAHTRGWGTGTRLGRSCGCRGFPTAGETAGPARTPSLILSQSVVKTSLEENQRLLKMVANHQAAQAALASSEAPARVRRVG